jgi:hypothetical protein
MRTKSPVKVTLALWMIVSAGAFRQRAQISGNSAVKSFPRLGRTMLIQVCQQLPRRNTPISTAWQV